MLVAEIHWDVVTERERLAALVRRRDPDQLPASQAPTLWQEFDLIARQAATAKTRLARRVEDSYRWGVRASHPRPTVGHKVADLEALLRVVPGEVGLVTAEDEDVGAHEVAPSRRGRRGTKPLVRAM